jgi:hypothetical protein
MAKAQHKKFRATIEYRIEVNEDYQPSVKDEKLNFVTLIKGDPEITHAKVTVEEI